MRRRIVATMPSMQNIVRRERIVRMKSSREVRSEEKRPMAREVIGSAVSRNVHMLFGVSEMLFGVCLGKASGFTRKKGWSVTSLRVMNLGKDILKCNHSICDRE